MITMSHKEIDRLEVMQLLSKKHVSQRKAATQLKISTRQVRRLIKRYRSEGPQGLVSKHRGHCANNKVSSVIKNKALDLVVQHYPDFGPTFAHEKLIEQHRLSFSVETLRQWMMAAGIWKNKSAKKVLVHQSRPRRRQRGELIQIDGSPHDWFENRADTCNLTVFIDDATGELMALYFTATETTQAYMETLSNYLNQYGRPVAFYSDKHGIFRVNHPNNQGGLTQFSRALKTIDVELICANSPQAKGRVERANKTLQDRLVKELRLRNISSMEEANRYLPEFMADYNQRFSVKPASPQDAHRKILHTHTELQQILSIQNIRSLSKNLTCQYQNVEYQIQSKNIGYRLRYSKVTICEDFSGKVTLLHKGKSLPYKTFKKGAKPTATLDEKNINHAVKQAKLRQQKKPNYKPKPDHPWRTYPNKPQTTPTP
jgi:transposase